MPTRSVSPEVIECPLCCGAGELTRAEILDRLGVKDFARVAQLSAEEAFRLLQQKHSSDHQQAWARFESQLMIRTAELRERFKDELRLALSEKESLSRRVEDSLREIAQLHEKNQLLEGEMAKVARIGAREEQDFAQEAKTWAGVWISDKLPRNGDFILAYRATNGDPVEPKILIDCKDKSAVAESDIEKLVRDAKERSIRVAVAEPDIDIGNIETVLETLSTTCYFLSSEKNRYRFSLSPNLNKLLADRRASVPPKKIDERLRAEVQKVFTGGTGVDRVYFPEKSGQITDRPVLSLVVMSPEQSISEKATRDFIESATKESGTSGRTYKSGLVWAVPDSPDALRDEARKVLAWEDIADEEDDLHLDEAQKRQLAENVKKAQRDAKEIVWRTYKNLMLLGKDNSWKTVDLGLVHSSAANSLVELILNRLRQDGDIEDAVSPSFLDRNWPPAFKEWNTKAVRDAFFASPQFPRLLNSESLKDTIARGVQSGMLGYLGKKPDGTYDPFHWNSSLTAFDVELSDDMYIIKRATAEAYLAGKSAPTSAPVAPSTQPPIEGTSGSPKPPTTTTVPLGVSRVSWQGDVPPKSG